MKAFSIVLLLLTGLSCAQTDRQDGARLEPVGQILYEDIDECSGIVWTGGAYYVHNDSGDDAIVYRSTDLTFPPETTSRLPLGDAHAVDWEDITALEGDLLIGDIGDNRRERPFLTLYRARYSTEDGTDRLDLVGTYPFTYPDDRHDAEALLTIDGTVYLVSKAREEKVTNVYRFDGLITQENLPAGTYNVPALIAQLEIGDGEQITGGCYDPQTETIVLLTYTHLLQYDRDAFSGPPKKRLLIAARQCEALCFRERSLVVTNEQRDVFTIDDFVARELTELLPPRGNAVLLRISDRVEVDGTGASWRSRATPVELQDARPGEQIRWARTADHLLLAGTLHYEDTLRPSGPLPESPEEPPRLGSAVLFCFADSASLSLEGDELFFALGVAHDHTPALWGLDLLGPSLGFEVLPDAEFAAHDSLGQWRFELALPLTDELGKLVQSDFLFDLHGVRLRPTEHVHFSGVDLFTVNRPYTWGMAQVR